MEVTFKSISKTEIIQIVPLLFELNEERISKTTLSTRVLEMVQQNYECIGVFAESKLIGMAGLWFQTRHYAGKSVELDHVLITKAYQGCGIGTKFMHWITNFVKVKGCLWIELNTYVHNFPSHKFYYNQGFVAKGYHLTKTL